MGSRLRWALSFVLRVVLLGTVPFLGCARIAAERLPPSEPPRYFIADDTTGSRYTTTRAEVRVVVEPREGFDYFMAETTELLPPLDASWTEQPPASFSLSSGSGLKIVHLWARDFRGGISAPARYEITLVENIILVGPSDFGCPSVEGGACAVFPAGFPNPVQEAVNLAQPGDAIWLHADPTATLTTYDGNITFDKSVVVEPAPGQDGRLIELRGDCLSVGVLRPMADEVTVRDLRVNAPTDCRVAINTLLSGDRDDASAGWSRGHLFERLFIEATATSISGSNSTEWAITPGDDTTVRNSIIYGWWEGALRTAGASDMTGFRFVNNTVVLVEPTASVSLEGAENAVVRNNILMVLNPEPGAAVTGDGSTNNSIVEGNLVSGFGAVVNSFIVEGFNTLGEPGLVSMTDLVPAQGGLSIDSGIPGDDTGDADFFGNPRSAGARLDVGAVEATSVRLPLGSTVLVGLDPAGCPFETSGACDFYPRAGEPPAVQQAIDASLPGGQVHLFGGQLGEVARYRAQDTDIDRTLHIRPAPGEEGTVAVVSDDDSDEGLFRVVVAENARFSDLLFECTSCGSAIWFDPGDQNDSMTDDAANDGIVERCIITATTNSGTDDGVTLGHRGTLVDSLILGPWEGLVRTTASDVRVVGNTFYGVEPESPSYVFDIRDSTSFLGANNLVDVSTATTPEDLFGLRTNDTTVGAVLENNQFYGLTVEVSGPMPIGTAATMPAGTNCVQLAAGPPTGGECAGPSALFVDPSMGDFGLQPGSPALDAGNEVFSDSDSDLFRNERVVNTIDVGAVERQP